MKPIRKYRMLLIHIVLLVFLAGLVLKFAEEILTVKEAIYCALFSEQLPSEEKAEQVALKAVENDGDEWYLERPLIYHAGGEIHGSSYTNSLEAVEKTLEEHPGKCFIEIDFQRTSDGALVCAHLWEDTFLGCTEAPSLDEFLDRKIQGKFTPLTAERLLQIMAENPDMYLVTDIKVGSVENSVVPLIAELVEMCGRDESILERFVIQLYSGLEKPEIKEIYPFDDDQFLLTTYMLGYWRPEMAQICSEQGIRVIALPHGQIPDEYVKDMTEKGYTIYEYTVNRADEAHAALARGICGFYTDNLVPEDLMP